MGEGSQFIVTFPFALSSEKIEVTEGTGGFDGVQDVLAVATQKLGDPAKASIPIIAMTANVFEEDRERAEEAGVSGYIPKPIEIEKLLAALENLTD